MSLGIQWFEYIMVLLIHPFGCPHNLDFASTVPLGT